VKAPKYSSMSDDKELKYEMVKTPAMDVLVHATGQC
jgi:hypothetical protein